MNRCPACNQAIREGAQFCKHCGAALSSAGVASSPSGFEATSSSAQLPAVICCPVCGESQPSSIDVCTQCGTSLKGPQGKDPEGPTVDLDRDTVGTAPDLTLKVSESNPQEEQQVQCKPSTSQEPSSPAGSISEVSSPSASQVEIVATQRAPMVPDAASVVDSKVSRDVQTTPAEAQVQAAQFVDVASASAPGGTNAAEQDLPSERPDRANQSGLPPSQQVTWPQSNSLPPLEKIPPPPVRHSARLWILIPGIAIIGCIILSIIYATKVSNHASPTPMAVHPVSAKQAGQKELEQRRRHEVSARSVNAVRKPMSSVASGPTRERHFSVAPRTATRPASTQPALAGNVPSPTATQEQEPSLAQQQQQMELMRQEQSALKQKQEELEAQEHTLQLQQQAMKKREAEGQSQVQKATHQTPLPYSGPSSGTLVWKGEIHGTELVDIVKGSASTGEVEGTLPGVPCLVQPADPKHVSVAVAPGPSNGWNRLVLRIKGKGQTLVKLSWSLP